MQTFFSVFVQSFLFLVTFAVGSFLLHPFHLQTALSSSDATHVRSFVWDGLLLMLILYILVLVVEALMKRLQGMALWSTVAVGLAGALGLMMKFGFISTDR